MSKKNTEANEALVKKLSSIKEVLDQLEKPSNFDVAIHLAQHVMPNKIEGSGNNPHFKSDHITFDQLVLVATTILPALGLRFKQKAHALEDNDVGIETIICGHGEEESYGIIPMKASTRTPHASAGNVTYAKRYSLALALNISHGKDDDGLSAEIETRQNKIADSAPAVDPSKYQLSSGETIIASYDSPESFLAGCRLHAGKPKSLDCVAVFNSSKEEILRAQEDSEAATREAFRKLLGAYR